MRTLLEQAKAVKQKHDETLAIAETFAAELKKSGKLKKSDEDKLTELKAKKAK